MVVILLIEAEFSSIQKLLSISEQAWWDGATTYTFASIQAQLGKKYLRAWKTGMQDAERRMVKRRCGTVPEAPGASVSFVKGRLYADVLAHPHKEPLMLAMPAKNAHTNKDSIVRNAALKRNVAHFRAGKTQCS